MKTKKTNERTMRLRYVATADFRMGDRGIFEEILKKRPELKSLRDGDVVMVRSGQGNQVLFIHGFREVTSRDPRRENRALVTERLRLEWGTWSELMLADYAKMVGIKLAGLPTLEEIVAKLKRSFSVGGAS